MAAQQRAAIYWHRRHEGDDRNHRPEREHHEAFFPNSAENLDRYGKNDPSSAQ